MWGLLFLPLFLLLAMPVGVAAEDALTVYPRGTRAEARAPRAASVRLRDSSSRGAHNRLRLVRLTPEQRAARLVEGSSLARKIGFARTLPESMTARELGASLRWRPLANGGLTATLDIGSDDAVALRLGLRIINLPDDTELIFYGEGSAPQRVHATEIHRTLQAASSAGSASADADPAEAQTYWSPIVEGDSLAVEIYLPPGVAPEAFRVRPSLLSHLVFSPISGQMDLLMPRIGEAQSCSLDAVCSETWAEVRDSVARISYVSGGGSFLCSGTLLNDTAGTGIPYFLTAHHCIDNQSAASSMSSFWFYEASACESGALSPAALQIGGGAELLYTSVNTDVTFLRLNNDPPAGVTFAGWSTAGPERNQPVTVIHHPRGDLKKIGEGTIDGFRRCVEAGEGFTCTFRSRDASDANFVDVEFTLGTTETGSSGSAIFSNDGQLVLGNLWGGSSTCSNLSGTNAFGRFDRSYVQGGLGQWLDTVPSFFLTVSLAGEGSGSVSSAPAGIDCGSSCSAFYDAGTAVSLTAMPDLGSEFAGWGGDCSGTGACVVNITSATGVSAEFREIPDEPEGNLTLDPSGLAFEPQSVATRSLPLILTIVSDGEAPVQVTDIDVESPFALGESDCGALPFNLGLMESCTLEVHYVPPSEGEIEGSLELFSDAGSFPLTLTGFGESSLVTHYYAAILGRIPDASGKAFWEGEYQRMQDLGADLNEVWYTMALNFYASDEYLDGAPSDQEFLEDLYRTFFSRDPDTAGLNFWLGQLQLGMPRDVVLLSFLFSPEFISFTQSLFGATGVSPEFNAVMDLYRGFLARLPDEEGLTFWLGEFRDAQCASEVPVAHVIEVAEEMTRLFAESPEYLARNRTSEQYVIDLYNGILRRGGDLAGVRFWIDALDDGLFTRDEIRRSFLNSVEFERRVEDIVESAATACAGL